VRVGMDRDTQTVSRNSGRKEFRERSDANLRTAREVDAHQVACD
jgi:hypothetical protein